MSFPIKPPKESGKNEMNIRKIFLSFFYLDGSYSPKNEKTYERVLFDRPKGGDENQRKNPYNDLFPVSQGKKTGPSVLQL